MADKEPKDLFDPKSSSKDRFTWNDDDVVMRDEDGKEITPRQAKEQQLIRMRAEVEEDLPDDSDGE